MAKDTKTEETVKEKKNAKKDYVFAVGRRKEAVARVRLYRNLSEELKWGDLAITKGQIIVNKMPIQEYFSGEVAKKVYDEPFRVTNSLNLFTGTISVEGGGFSSQLGAVIHGVARALSLFDPEKFRPILKAKGFLTRDARVRQRRKEGMGGKSRRKKQSPKR